MLVDFAGSYDKTDDEEYAEIEEMIKLALPQNTNLDFHRNIQPYALDNQSFDVYIFDFGGLLPGCDSLMSSMLNEFSKQVENHPNTLFIIWSSFTGRMYEELLQCEVKDFMGLPHNVIVSNGLNDDVENRLKEIGV